MLPDLFYHPLSLKQGPFISDALLQKRVLVSCLVRSNGSSGHAAHAVVLHCEESNLTMPNNYVFKNSYKDEPVIKIPTTKALYPRHISEKSIFASN